jgi:hypothetical protein
VLEVVRVVDSEEDAPDNLHGYLIVRVIGDAEV